MSDLAKERTLLDMRNAIADKEWHIACANMQTARAGEWTCDWHAGVRDADIRIEACLRTLLDDEQQEVAK